MAKRYTISKARECLSIEYINNKTQLQWKCHNTKHKTSLAPYDTIVTSKTWCSECANNKKLKGLLFTRKYAVCRNGICLSTEYINTKQKMPWECHNDEHLAWLANFEHVVRRNQWCPECYQENRKKQSLIY